MNSVVFCEEHILEKASFGIREVCHLFSFQWLEKLPICIFLLFNYHLLKIEQLFEVMDWIKYFLNY